MMDKDDFPHELHDLMKAVNSSTKDMEKALKPLLATERSELVRKVLCPKKYLFFFIVFCIFTLHCCRT